MDPYAPRFPSLGVRWWSIDGQSEVRAVQRSAYLDLEVWLDYRPPAMLRMELNHEDKQLLLEVLAFDKSNSPYSKKKN